MENLNKSSEQVDFDLLRLTISSFKDTGFKPYLHEIDNFKTFFYMLTKSSTFAHLAHKELKKRKESE